jgi:hypothetical protein
MSLPADRRTIAAMNPLSGVLDEAWRMYRRFAVHLLAIAFVIYLVAAVIAALLSLIGVFGTFLGLIVEFFAAFLLQATLVKAVQDIRDGRADLSLGETVSAATPYIWAVAGASILAGIAITVGLFLVIVPGLWLITIWAVLIPVIVIERSGVFAAFGRSHRLVKGYGWHVFGTLVLVFIILIVVDIVLGVIFLALPVLLRTGLSSIISGTLVAPFLALVVTLIYYRLLTAHGEGPAGPTGPTGMQQPGVAEPPWPAQPTAPTEPTDTAGPTGPAQPTGPAGPAGPAEPSGTERPWEPQAPPTQEGPATGPGPGDGTSGTGFGTA